MPKTVSEEVVGDEAEAVASEAPKAPTSKPSGASACVNCGEPAVITVGGASANELQFCAAHCPANLRNQL